MSLFDSDTIIKVGVDQIKTDVQLKNIRTVFDQETIVELAESIYEDGLMVPLLVMDSYDNSNNDIIELVAGARRLRAIKYIRNSIEANFMDDGIPCIQFEGSHSDAVFASAEENIAREEVDDVDIATWINDRVTDGLTQTEIAERLHKSLQYVSFRAMFHQRASDNLKAYLREKGIGFTAAYELSKNLSDVEQDKWVEEYKKLGQKISLKAARVAGKTNKSTKPGQKLRDRMLAKATVVSEDRGSEIAHGMVLALSWVDGLIDTEAFEDALSNET